MGISITKLRTDDYTTQLKVKSNDANITYIGKALLGSLTSNSVWQIQKIDDTSGTVITWADGSNAFNQIWDDRENLTYS